MTNPPHPLPVGGLTASDTYRMLASKSNAERSWTQAIHVLKGSENVRDCDVETPIRLDRNVRPTRPTRFGSTKQKCLEEDQVCRTLRSRELPVRHIEECYSLPCERPRSRCLHV